MAFELMMRGGLWNTMTMVFKLDTLLELVRRLHPARYLNFCRIREAIGTVEERQTVEDVYEALEPVNFSKEIMMRIADRHPRSLSVLPVRKVFWSDWGSQKRVLQVFARLDKGNDKKNQTVFRNQKPGKDDNHHNFVSWPPLQTSATKSY